jgi:hypothetical protein
MKPTFCEQFKQITPNSLTTQLIIKSTGIYVPKFIVLSEMCVGRMTAGLAVSVFGKNNVV